MEGGAVQEGQAGGNHTVDAPGPRQAAIVLDLRQVGRGDLGIAGGKGANLGALVRAGFPVPDGFVVTTVAYDRFLAHNRLSERIAEAHISTHGSATIQTAFLAASVPVEVAEPILAAYQRLEGGPVAVRSSGTAEDLPGAAFAGQQDTFLNVVSAEALLDALRRCWASVWNDRACAYRARLGIDPRTVKLAVVVQRLVAADVAGVLFTANPVTGARDEMVIDGSPGLGEAVVSGLVTPDHIVVRQRLGRWGWRIAERRPGRREVIVRARAGGGTEHVAGSAAVDLPALSDRVVRRLARLGVAIQRHFGCPQDVEWAWAGGQVFILQARPITALPQPAPHPSRPMRMLAGILTEILPGRPYPLEFTTWGPDMLVSALLGPMLRTLGLEYRLDRSFIEEDGVVVRFTGRFPVRPTLRMLLAPVRLRRLARRFDPAHWRADPLLAEIQARARALEARDPRPLMWTDLLGMVHEALGIPRLVGLLRLRYIPRPALAAGRLRLVLLLLGAGNRFGTLLLTGVETRTMEANRTLEGLAARIRSDPALSALFTTRAADELWQVLEGSATGRAFLEQLRAFLDTYGHREVGATLQISKPTWKDAPEAVLGILKGLAATPPRAMPERLPWEVDRDRLLAHPLLRIPRLRSAFLSLLAEARWFPQVREDTRFAGTLVVPALRRTLLEFGRRLTDAGVLESPEQVFHFRLTELAEAGQPWPPSPARAADLRSLVRRRVQKRAELEGTPLLDLRLLGQPAARADALAHGLPGSPGIAEGPVRIVHDGTGFGTLLPGEVLVAPFTNPAWTPLFQRAAAVVVDSGGPASHAAIVAREYGIPAVMATVDGTRRLSDGQRVRVDGARGTVFRATEPPA